MEGYRLLSDKRMWKIGTKGRYGFLVSVVTTMFDFVLLNVGYLYAIHNIGDVGQFSEKVEWIFVNISYALPYCCSLTFTTNESCMRTG